MNEAHDAVTFSGGNDVIAYLTAQHRMIKTLFARVLETSGRRREEAFFELRRLLAVHETAEEQVVHPKAEKKIAGGEAIVAERLSEEQEAKEVLATLEDLDVDSAEFTATITSLQASVIEHAEGEEQHEFSALATALDDDELRSMERMVVMVEKIAPTRPHPEVKGRAANLIGGPFAAMVDRVRDAL